ncbi:MBL fold metallo-hydrolase RNA specificity domain-containing protein [Candidatus Zixiibacteriota bacterium]
MARLTFYGATGTVTGSRFLLEIQDKTLLTDCGLFQGPKRNRLRNWEPFPVDPAGIDHVLLTHAHIDHSGYLPRLCRDGFSGRVHCTHATADLCEILLRDSAHIQEEDARWANKKGYSKHKPALPLYTVENAEEVLQHFDAVYYGEDLFLDGDLRVKFKDAGHLLGSSLVDLKFNSGPQAKKILFSGDLGKPGTAMLRDTVQAYNVDYLVLESTYGGRLHDDVSPLVELARIIRASVERGGVLVVPAFSIGRSQTLLYAIRELEEAGEIPQLPVYMDSPMAIDATKIFEKRLYDLNLKTRVQTLEGTRILRPRDLHICRTKEQSVAINEIESSAIIISASGMATGGRILHHLIQRLPDPQNTILFVGHQAQGTRGRTMLEGKPTIKIHGRQISVRAKIENIFGFSGHADYREVCAWLMGFNRPPEKTFIVHGEPESSAALAEHIRKTFGWSVEVPQFGESLELDL